MRTGPDFTRILDKKLQESGFVAASCAGTSDPGPEPGAWRPGARPVFLFGDLRSGFTAGPARPAPLSGASTRTPVYGAGLGAQSRSSRRLSLGEHLALEALRTLGADSLSPDFTDAELKSAFRRLARRFHPDRHPGSSDGERAQLARSFAAACDAYRTLTRTIH
jgi:hypothetical protein